MGRQGRLTGSRLLGAELRRLRGGRTLKRIAELSASPPLAERCEPISAPTLSQIENGITFPSLDTLHSLSMIYQTTVQQLLDIVVQERLLGAGEPPACLAEARRQHALAMSCASWSEALRVATWAEHASTGVAALSWRVNRAQALCQLGMVDDAISIIDECLSHPDAPVERLYQVHGALAEALAFAGRTRSARLHAEAARTTAPADLDSAERLRLLALSAYVLLAVNAERADPQEARQAVRLLEEARELVDPADEQERSCLEAQLAFAHHLTGNALVAIRDLEKIATRSREKGHPRALVESLLLIGVVRRDQGRRNEALRSLDEAATLAAKLGDPTQAFEALFQAYRCVEGRDEKKAAHYLARCERFHPLVHGRGASVRAFESAAWGGAG